MPPRPLPHVWSYQAVVTSIVDGDGIRAAVVLWPWPLHTIALDIRLHGINCRELRDPGGKEARDALTALIPPDTVIKVTLTDRDKYGRILAHVHRVNDSVDVAAQMVADGWAVAWDGKGKRPVPDWPREAAA